MPEVRAGRPPKALATTTPDVDSAFTRAIVDPTERYAHLRANCPVALQNGGGGNGLARSGWLLTRYADIVEAAKQPEIFGQSIRWPGRRRPPLESNPPEHRALRALIQPFFMPKHIRTLEPVSRGLAVDLTAPLIAAGGGDFAEHVARPLPPQVLLSFLGQPNGDWVEVKRCCEASYLQSSTDPDDRLVYEAADSWLWNYAEAIVADRTAAPRDVETDVVTAMLGGRVDDKPVDEALVTGTIRLLLAAGHDSTTSALGACLRFVAEDPDLQTILREQPRKIPAAIEEILRLHTPVLQMPRTVMQDVELHGRSLCAGDAALLAFGSGNRDEAAFPDADRFKLDRMPNRHLSFGTGIHTCIGNILARQEILVTLEELLARTRAFKLAAPVEHEFWHPNGVTSLLFGVEAA